MRCPSFAVPSVSEREDLRLAALEQAGAVRARVDADLDLDRPDLLGAAAVRAALVDGDLLADEVLVDRLARLLDVALRRASPSRRPVAVGRCRADRERQLTSSTICSKSRCRFADLSCFESCSASVSARSSSPNCSRTGPSTAAERCFSSSGWSAARTCIWRVMSSSVESIESARASSPSSSSTIAPALAEADGLDPLPDRVAVVALELGGEVEVEPLRLAGLAAQLFLRLAQLHDLGVRELERLEERRPRGSPPRRPRPSSGRPSCRRRSGRASSRPRSRAASG